MTALELNFFCLSCLGPWSIDFIMGLSWVLLAVFSQWVLAHGVPHQHAPFYLVPPPTWCYIQHGIAANEALGLMWNSFHMLSPPAQRCITGQLHHTVAFYPTRCYIQHDIRTNKATELQSNCGLRKSPGQWSLSSASLASTSQ